MAVVDGLTAAGPSPIAGTGLFLTADLAAGAPVLSYAAPPAPTDEPARVNHSCDPSTGWSGATVLVALRDLAAGDEVTLDYVTGLADPAYLLRCHCETYRCRQMVEGGDWRIPQLQRRYAGHWTPHVQSLIDGLTAAG